VNSNKYDLEKRGFKSVLAPKKEVYISRQEEVLQQRARLDVSLSSYDDGGIV
jgi:hypothetical protein